MISCSATCKSILNESLPLLTKLTIDNSSQLNVTVAKRFRDIKEIHINSLLSWTVVDTFDIEEEIKEVEVDIETTHRVVPFLSKFDMLERVYFGVKDEYGNVTEDFYTANGYFWEGDEGYPNEGSRERMLRFIDTISIGYSSGALPKHLKISGLCCPDTVNNRHGGECLTCSRAVRTFPLDTAFESRGSSSSNALSGREYGLDVCLERGQIESIIESRPGGSALLHSDLRVIRLLGSARRYKVGTDSQKPLYIAKYNQDELAEIQRVINYANLDVKAISSQAVSDAIMSSFGLVSQNQCYIPEATIVQLKNQTGLSIAEANFARPLSVLLPHLDGIMAVVISGSDDTAYVGIEMECIRLLRRFIEEFEPTSFEITEALPSMANYLFTDEYQVEVMKFFVGMLARGSSEDKRRVVETCNVASFAELLRSPKDSIVTGAITALGLIVADGESDKVASEVAKMVSFDFGSMHFLGSSNRSVVNSTLTVLAAAKDCIDIRSIMKILPHLAHIMKTPDRTDMLPKCSILLRGILGRKNHKVLPIVPPIQKLLDSGIVSTMTKLIKTNDRIVYTNLARALLNLATRSTSDQFADLGSDFLQAIVSLQDSKYDEIAEEAISTLHGIADTNKVIWSSWKERADLRFGEFEVKELVDSDAEESDAESCTLYEEAEEVDDDQVKLEEELAISASNDDTNATTSEEVEEVVAISSLFVYPALVGLPNALHKKILCFVGVGDGFFSRWVEFRRQRICRIIGLRMIRKYQKNTTDVMRFVLTGKTEHEYRHITISENDRTIAVEQDQMVHETVRTIAADLLSRMNHSNVGHGVSFRLRSDSVSYLLELVQSHMIQVMERAIMAAIHSHRTKVQRDDVLLITPKNICNVGMRLHGTVDEQRTERGGCSCSLPSFSGTVWRWPADDCHDVLPPRAGHRIIRLLAYRSGINEMTDDAFMLLEAHLLHTFGTLLVEAYESSFEAAKSAKFLEKSVTLVYSQPMNRGTFQELHSTDDGKEAKADDADSTESHPASAAEDDDTSRHEPTYDNVIDMFGVPPPPVVVTSDDTESDRKEIIYTIVPGQIAAAAERRGIIPHHVYGVFWPKMEEELPIESSYYFKPYDEDYSDSDSSDDEDSNGVAGEQTNKDK